MPELSFVLNERKRLNEGNFYDREIRDDLRC